MGKSTLYLLNYNNYYNRTIKKYETLEEYLSKEELIYSKAEINFNPNDGVNTTHTLNCGEIAEPNYLLVLDQETNEFTRWFVIDMVRERNSQYTFSLRRDLIADYKDDITDAPCFIEKATVANSDDPAIFNNEAMTFNQIKKKESLITDETRIPWIVGYVPKNAWKDTATSISADTQAQLPANIEVSTLSSWGYADKINTPIAYSFEPSTTFRFLTSYESASRSETNICLGNFTQFSSSINTVKATDAGTDWSGTYVFNGADYKGIFERAIAPLQTSQYAAMFQAWYQTSFITGSKQTLMELDGKILHTTDTDTYYRVRVRDTAKIAGDETETDYTITNDTIITYADSNFNRAEVLKGSKTSKTWELTAKVQFLKITLEQVVLDISTIITGDHNRLLDAPYDMFCIPYGSIPVRTEALSSFNTIKDVAIDMASAISTSMGAGVVYDLQLLPYCPCRELLNSTQGTLDAYKGSFSPIVTEAGPVSVLIWCQYAEFNFEREYTGVTPLNTLLVYDEPDPIEKKIKNETSFNRLCSPNYNGVFEFNPMKNNGINSWEISCKYKPFSPYIHINPVFNKDSLYGNNYGDARGLVCGGDFSLTQMTDAWATYQLNNKNYQNSFDRQIENMEVNNSVQRTLEQVNAITGTLQGTATGAMIGHYGGGISAGIGAAVGGVTSAIGGIADMVLNEQLRNEALDYTKDQFAYNLQNIQALPQSLAKLDALNPQNKIFPFVEYYTCTDQEKDALRNKIKYDGMTIMRIGTLLEFLHSEPTYIKARLIRLEDIGEFHFVKEIANELYKGVFI